MICDVLLVSLVSLMKFGMWFSIMVLLSFI